MTIELKVDIRDAAAWGKLDSALNRLADGKKKHRQGQQDKAEEGEGEAESEGQQQHGERHAGGGAGLEASLGLARSSLGIEALEGDYGEVEGEEGEVEEAASPDSAAALAAATEAAGEGGSGASSSKGRGFMGGIRQHAANKLRQLAESTAAHISRWVPGRLLGCVVASVCGRIAGLAGRRSSWPTRRTHAQAPLLLRPAEYVGLLPPCPSVVAGCRCG